MKMLKKSNFKILLICLAFGHICVAKPANNEAKEQSYAPSTTQLCQCTNIWKALLCENTDKMTSSLQLLEFILSGLLDITETVTGKVKNITDQILSDQELMQIANNDEVQIFIQKLQNSKDKRNNCRCSSQNNRLFNVYLTQSANYYQQEQRNRWSPDGKAILKVIKKYNHEKMLADYETDVNKFTEKFEEKYGNLKEAIDKENNRIGVKISSWYRNFNTIKNSKGFGTKVRAFLELVDIYKMEFIEEDMTYFY